MNIVAFSKTVSAEVKFYYSDEPHPALVGRQSLIGFYNDLVVFPDYVNGTYDQIVNLSLIGKTLKVELKERPKGNGKGASFATIVGDPLQAVVEPEENLFDASPIVLMDGQNFLKDVVDLNANASAYDVLISILGKFKLPPQAIIFYVCKESSYKISKQLQDIEAKAKSDPNYQIKICYRKPKYSNASGKRTAKTDVDPDLQADLGILTEKTKGSKDVLLLFAGDSDYERVCRQWLSETPNFLDDCYARGRKLAIASSFQTKSFSSNLREVCNDSNAQAIIIEDFVPADNASEQKVSS
ncbi:MAG: hypothetical protein BWY53_00561 [Parcubacteria group bacterium ADurb.Bin326]|nr:MAG: hypothetical protein BWY53_00561 [Parcubacteria group bacterium ADurb.Bin326]